MSREDAQAASAAAARARLEAARDAVELEDEVLALRAEVSRMVALGLARADDLAAAQELLEASETRLGRMRSLRGLFDLGATSEDLRDLFVRLPGDLRRRPALATLTRGNRVRSLGVLLVLVALAAWIAMLPGASAGG